MKFSDLSQTSYLAGSEGKKNKLIKPVESLYIYTFGNKYTFMGS